MIYYSFPDDFGHYRLFLMLKLGKNYITKCFSNFKENYPGILLNSRFVPVCLGWVLKCHISNRLLANVTGLPTKL